MNERKNYRKHFVTMAIVAAVIAAMVPCIAIGVNAKLSVDSEPVAKIGDQTYYDLHEALDQCTEYKQKTVELLRDVTLTGTWTPIAIFNGTFEGNNHTIYNLKVEGTSENVGMFATAGEIDTYDYRANIQNFVLSGASVTSTSDNVGIIVGYGFANVTNVTIKNSTLDAQSSERVGGFVGSSCSLITNCTLENSSVTASEQVGGISGYS